MSFSSDDSVKERIREAIDIVELVSQYVPLKRSGRNYVARCPWHDDSRPSLQINPVRQTFKCWVCDIGGDVFSFVMRVENVDFKEALEILADKAGIQLPKKSAKKIFIETKSKNLDPNAELAELDQDGSEEGYLDGQNVSTPQKKEISRQDLFKATSWLGRIYHEALLKSDEAEIARKYLKERGIQDADIEKFQIGYAPMEHDWLSRKVKGIPERLQILELVGNLINRDSQDEMQDRTRSSNPKTRYYDRFRGRLLFPIRDTQDRTVAFGGRLIPGSPLSSPAKYVNSPETPLFSKHRMLYGLDIARHRMKETRRALIMEGYTDVIVAHRFGFGEAVAVLGTALGSEHIRILKRYVDKMILVLDGDEAGRKRADQVLELFVAQGVDMSVLTLPAGLDPADFLHEHGNEAFNLLLETETADALEHAFQSVSQNVDLKNDIIGSSKALDALLGIIAQAPVQGTTPDDPIRIRIEKTIQSLSHRFLVGEEQIRQRLKEKRRRIENKPRFSDPTEQTDSRHGELSNENKGIWSEPDALPDRLEQEMLELLLADPTAIYEFWEPVPVERCRSPITKMIYEKSNELLEANKLVTFDRLIVAFDDPKMKSFLVKLDESGQEKRSVKTSSLFADENDKTPPAFDDELSDLEESLSQEAEPLSPELRKRLIREIIEGFDRRDAERNRMSNVNQLRNDNLTEKEKVDKLLQLQEQLRRQQEEKRRRMEN